MDDKTYTIELMGLAIIFLVQLISFFKNVIAVRKSNKKIDGAVSTMKNENKNTLNAVKKENEDLESRLMKEISKISTNILAVKEDTKHLKKIHKHRDFEHTLIEKMKNQVVLLTEKGYLRQVILMTFEKVIPVIHNILDTDFSNVDANKTYEEIKRSIYLVLPSIKFDILNTTEEDFNKGCKEKIKIEIKQYTAKLILLSEKMTNGDRRDKFEDISIELIQDIIKIVKNEK